MGRYVVDWQLTQEAGAGDRAFGKVLVPLDGSDRAALVVRYAAGLATALGGHLQLLHVIDPSALSYLDGEPSRHGEPVDQLAPQRVAWATSYLTEVAKSLEVEGLLVDIKVAFGRPEEAILETAVLEDDCLIVMSTHGRSGWGRLVMGSVADGVLQKGEVPVLLFRAAGPVAPPARPPRTVIVPLDGSSVAERALPVARSIAGTVGARVLLARVVVGYAATPLVLMGTGAGDYIPMPAEDGEARSYLDDRVNALRMGHIDADSVLSTGDPGAEVVRLAAKTPDCLVVMSTHGRSGLQRIVLGGVADRVVRESGAPVLVVRSAG